MSWGTEATPLHCIALFFCPCIRKINLCSDNKFIIKVEIHWPILSTQEDTGSLSTRRQGLTAVYLAFALVDLQHLEGMRFCEVK